MYYTLEQIMEKCVDKAIRYMSNDFGGPFGASVVKKISDNQYEIISLSANTVLHENDPTCHAEMNAIRLACKELKTFDLSDYELVTTGQSCPMCLSAIMWSRISKVYYGTTYDDATNIGFIDEPIHEHLKGNQQMLDEIPFGRDIAIKCHEYWKDKQSKIMY